MIVILHASYLFFGYSFANHWQLGQGVSFFFVLSGFILSCVYPKLDGLTDIKHFLLARLGRIWPSHLIMACLALCLLPSMYPSIAVILTNLLLLQAWIPKESYYFSLNSVSWSLSCEAFCYVCFIGLIKPWKFKWIGKIALSAGIVLISCFLVHFFAQDKHHLELDKHFFLVINPPIRLVEFIIGIITAQIWLSSVNRLQLNKWVATTLEVIVFSAVILEIAFISLILPANQCPSFLYWLGNNGPAPLFGLLILVASMQQGYLTKALAHPIFVWLGEISYSIYLVHFLLISCLNVYIPEFFKINPWLGFSVYWTLVILLSSLNYNLVENPCRQAVKVFNSLPPKSHLPFTSLARIFRDGLRSTVLPVSLAAILIITTGLYIKAAQKRFQFTDLNINHSSCGNAFVLEKVSIANAQDGTKIKLAWKSLLEQSFNRTVVIQFIDKHGKWLSEHREQDHFYKHVHPGQMWSQIIYVPSNELPEKDRSNIGLRLCIHKDHNSENYLPISGKHTDFWGTRLIIPVPQ